MMKYETILVVLSAILATLSVSAFAPQPMMPIPTQAATFLPVNSVQNLVSASQKLNLEIQPMSFNQYIKESSANTAVTAIDSSSTFVSIQEYHKPTPEELAAKKRNFNLWFWGGGFVAPFAATVFYFGFRFWER